MKAGRAKGFTLIELLVVVSIIGVLAGILLPALGAGKEAARKAVCGANLKSIGTASQTYSTDYKGLTPVGVRDTDNSGNVIWSGGGIGYTLYGSMVSSHLNGDVKTFYCPSAGHQYKVDDVNNGAQNFGQPALNARSSYYQRGVPQGAQKNLNVTVTGDSRISNLNDLHIYNGAIFINHKNKINTLFSDSSISLLSVPDVWRNSFSSFGGPTVTGTWYQIDDNAIIVSP
ncbi:DUF1559 domain-containing protein [Candidatus Pacearchaeota archaeon]|nr:DUF1559 domain-containing protein [Candidatus Pacearchaeota archaeon]